MSSKKRPYTGTTDGVATAKRKGLERFAKFFCDEYGFTNWGTLSVRIMKSAPADIQRLPIDNPKARPWLSVHATGRAVDLHHPNRKIIVAVCDFLVANADQLGIEEIHDYNYKADGSEFAWGRGWRCSRNAWKIYDAKANAGTPGGTKQTSTWIHVELSPEFADDAKKTLDALTAADKTMIPKKKPKK